ncbi:MAG: fibronectin type III domain-containing protein [Pirellulaceae bacterium]
MRRSSVFAAALILALFSVSCDSSTETDETPPEEVAGLTATLEGGGGDEQVVLVWADPTDTDLAEIEITYTPEGSARILVSPGVETYTFDGLSPDTQYTFTMRTVDESDNLSEGVSTSISTDGTPPVPGGGGTLESISISGYYFGLAWTKASDNRSPQGSLEYRAYYCYSPTDTDPFTDVSSTESNGTPIGDWQTDIDQIGFDPPTEGVCWLTVIVRDELGYQAIYTSDWWGFVF